MSRTRATVWGAKSARARRRKLLAEIRALFSLKGSIDLPADELDAPCFDLLRRERPQLDGVALLPPACLGDVTDDLAQCLRVALKRLRRKEAPRAHGFDVFADRHVDLLLGVAAFPAGKGRFPAVGPQILVELAGQNSRLRSIGGVKVDPCPLIGVLDLD